jgi:acyl carrier protein
MGGQRKDTAINETTNTTTTSSTRAGKPDASEVDSVAVLDLVRELEQRLRIASIRIAIEGEDGWADVVQTLADLAATTDEKLR